jgi:hypothetical protein
MYARCNWPLSRSFGSCRDNHCACSADGSRPELEHAAAPFDQATAQAQPQLSSCCVVVGRGQSDAVVVNDEYVLISASESRDVNSLRAGRDCVCEQVAEDETESVRGDRELAAGAGDDVGARIAEIGDRPLHTLGYSRYVGGGLIRAHRLEDRVDELECARQPLTRILVAESVDERRFHVVRDEAREVVQCLGLSSKARHVLG